MQLFKLVGNFRCLLIDVKEKLSLFAHQRFHRFRNEW